MKSCAQTFPPIFERNFAKLVAPSSNNNKNCLVHLKGQSMLKKRCKQYQNRPINRDTTPVQICHHRMNSAPASERGKKTYKHHVFVPTASACSTIFPKLCMVIELVEAIKKLPSFFDPTHSFSYRVHEKFGLNNRHAVSQQ